MIDAVGVGVVLGGRQVLTDVSVSTTAHVTGIIGPNGSGKSTLLKAMVATLAVNSGSVRVDGVAVTGMTRKQIARRVAVVEQSPPSDLELCVFDTVALGRLPWQGLWPQASRSDDERVADALNSVGLTEHAGMSLAALSGGERQRVLLARALVQGADHLLLDEPTNHLDIRYQHEILALARERAERVVVVLHDVNLAARYCDEVVVLDQGRVIASGPPRKALRPALLEAVWGVRTEHLTTSDGYLHIAFTSSLQTPAPAMSAPFTAEPAASAVAPPVLAAAAPVPAGALPIPASAPPNRGGSFLPAPPGPGVASESPRTHEKALP